MQMRTQESQLSSLAEEGRSIYETKLKSVLEREHAGEAVAIHVDTGDYAVGKTHNAAAHALLVRHQADGRIVTFTIGSPTDADFRLAARITAGRK